MRIYVNKTNDTITRAIPRVGLDTLSRLIDPARVVTFIGGQCDGSTVNYPPRMEIEARREIEGEVYHLHELRQVRGIMARSALTYVCEGADIPTQLIARYLDSIATVWTIDEPDFINDFGRWYDCQIARISHWPGITDRTRAKVRRQMAEVDE